MSIELCEHSVAEVGTTEVPLVAARSPEHDRATSPLHRPRKHRFESGARGSAASRVGFAEALLGTCAVVQPRMQLSIEALMKVQRLLAAAGQIDVRALPIAAADGTAMRGPGHGFALDIAELATTVLGGRTRARTSARVRATAA